MEKLSKDKLCLPASWTVLSALGVGGFGLVAAVDTKAPDGRPRAVKKIIGAGTSDRRALLALRELRLQKHCSHRNILQLQQVLPFAGNQRDVYMVLPMGEGSLDRLVPVASERREELFQDLMSGLAFMHSAQVAHRDLKPSNCMLVQGVLQIGDFGAAKALGGATWDPQLSPRMTTHSYAAPEVILAEFGQPAPPVGLAVDLWGAGCVYYEMGSGTVLFGGAGRDRRAVLDLILRLAGSGSLYSPQLPGCSAPAAQRTISRLLQVDPRNRPTAAAFLYEMGGTAPVCRVAQPDQPRDAALGWDELQARVADEMAMPGPLRRNSIGSCDSIDTIDFPPNMNPTAELSDLQTPEYWPSAQSVEHYHFKPRECATPLSVHELHTPEVWPGERPLR